jgi:hypoxanthine phosphoribosyltransferase
MGSRIQGFNTIQQLAGDNLLSGYSEYATIRSTLRFKCNKCSDVFITTSFLYSKSEDSKRCVCCKQKLKIDSATARDVFIGRCKERHGSYYDYSKVAETFSAKTKLTIICPKHGEFLQTSDSHLNKGHGCSVCKIDYVTGITRSTKADFVFKSNNIHNFKYNYELVQYVNAITPVSIKCTKHGVFLQKPDVHLRGSGCPICTNTSVAVQNILGVLDEINIPYTTEKSFPGCVGITGRSLRFDIYLPDRNLCIEYDGPHHFAPRLYGNMTDDDASKIFVTQQQNDSIKDKFCEKENIQLLRIPYTVHHPEAFVRKYISEEFVADRFYYSYDMLQEDVIKLSNYIKSFNYEKFAIYGIARGGILFSIPLSYHFDGIAEYGVVTFQRYDGNDKTVRFDITHKSAAIPIFVIDDLISSGITMNKTIKALQHKFKRATIHPMVIFGEENKDNVFFVREHPKQWVVFPYEL